MGISRVTSSRVSLIIGLVRLVTCRLMKLARHVFNLVLPVIVYIGEFLNDHTWDGFLTLISGALLLYTGYSALQDSVQQVYVLLVAHTRYHAYAAVTLGVATIFLGFFRLAWPHITTWKNLKNYALVLVSTVLIHGVFWLAVSISRKWVFWLIPDILQDQLQTLDMSGGLIGQAAELREAWDRLQITLYCCGVEGYQDYKSLHSSMDKQMSPVPESCCVLRPEDDPPRPVNSRQCMSDAAAGVVDSVFLHVRGCSSPLSAWLNEYSSTFLALASTSLLCQSAAVVYVMWKNKSLWQKFLGS